MFELVLECRIRYIYTFLFVVLDRVSFLKILFDCNIFDVILFAFGGLFDHLKAYFCDLTEILYMIVR